MLNVPSLRIAGPKCALVRDKELKEGTWFLDYPDGTFKDLEDELKVIIEAFKMKAVDWIVKPPVISFNKNSPCYKAIQARSRDDDRCQWGPEYVLELENEKATLYLGNKSSRDLMSSIRVGGEYTLVPYRRQHDHYVWYVPRIREVSNVS